MPDGVVQKKVPSKATVSEQFSLWARIVVGVGGVLLIAGALISLWHSILLVSPHDEINPAVRVFAAYTFSRDLGLAIVLVTALLLRARATLNVMLLLTGFIQMLEAFTDCLDHRWAIVPAAVVIGASSFWQPHLFPKHHSGIYRLGNTKCSRVRFPFRALSPRIFRQMSLDSTGLLDTAVLAEGLAQINGHKPDHSRVQ